MVAIGASNELFLVDVKYHKSVSKFSNGAAVTPLQSLPRRSERFGLFAWGKHADEASAVTTCSSR